MILTSFSLRPAQTTERIQERRADSQSRHTSIKTTTTTTQVVPGSWRQLPAN